MKSLKHLSKLFLLFFIVFFLFKGIVFLYLKATPKLEIGSANNVLVYDNKEKLFFQGNNDREWTNLSDISKYVVDSTIYTEDKHFYKHNGFDFFRIIKK